MLETETVLRLVAATLIGLVVGFMRRHKEAGIRTFALISLGAAAFTLISIDPRLGAGDPSRILGQIVTGIGFLGLGVIWKHGGKLSGLTTAAAVWVTAALGVLAALAFWVEAVAAVVLTMAILYSKKPLQKVKMEE